MRADFSYRWTVMGLNAEGCLTAIANRESEAEVLAAAAEFATKYNRENFDTFYLVDRNAPCLVKKTGTLNSIPFIPPPPIVWR